MQSNLTEGLLTLSFLSLCCCCSRNRIAAQGLSCCPLGSVALCGVLCRGPVWLGCSTAARPLPRTGLSRAGPGRTAVLRAAGGSTAPACARRLVAGPEPGPPCVPARGALREAVSSFVCSSQTVLPKCCLWLKQLQRWQATDGRKNH